MSEIEQPAQNQLSPLDVVGKLTSFLSSNMLNFHPIVRNVIGLATLALIAIITLHSFIAESYLRGSLYIVKSKNGALIPADGYFMFSGSKFTLADRLGNWSLPVSGFLPKTIHIRVQDPFAEKHALLAEFELNQWPLRNNSDEGPIIKIHQYRKTNIIEIVSGVEAYDLRFQLATLRSDDPPENPLVDLQLLTHLEGLGDVACPGSGWCGTIGQSRRLEGFLIYPVAGLGDVRIEYMGHVSRQGDTPWLSQGAFCGTRGEARALEGFAIRLQGLDAPKYNVLYQAHLEGIGNSGIFGNGAFAGTRNESRRVEAIRVWIEAR